MGTKGAWTSPVSCDLGDPRRADWTSTDGAKGCGDLGSRFLVLCDRSELENGCANGAGTDFDYAALIKIYSLVDIAWLAGLTYFTGLLGVLVGMLFQVFVWLSSKGCCYGNQLNVGWSDHYSLLRHSTTDWPIVNLLSTGSVAIIRYIMSKFRELPSSNLGVYAVKTRNFCRDPPAL